MYSTTQKNTPLIQHLTGKRCRIIRLIDLALRRHNRRSRRLPRRKIRISQRRNTHGRFHVLAFLLRRVPQPALVRVQPDSIAVEEHRVEVFAHGAQPVDVVAAGSTLVRGQADAGGAGTIRQQPDAAGEDGRPRAPVEGEELEGLAVAEHHVDGRAEAVVFVQQVAGCVCVLVLPNSGDRSAYRPLRRLLARWR